MWRVLIVEDSPAAAELLQGHLARYGEAHDEAFSAQVIGSAMEFLDGHHEADLVFLDIDLPGLSGMEAAGLWRLIDEETPLIFVTNLAQFAMEGYAVQALDFMLKPVSYQAFEPRMTRALRIMRRNVRATISVTTSDGLRIVDRRDIIYIEVLQHYLYWHVAGTEGVAFRSRGPLKDLAEELGSESFCRIAAGYLVNMGQVARLNGDTVELSDGTVLAFSHARKKEATEAILRYAGRGA